MTTRILLIPGLARTKDQYTDVIRFLEQQGYQVSVLDIETTSLPTKKQFKSILSKQIRKIPGSPEQKFILLGESMGALLGLWCATFLPQIQHVIVINPVLKLRLRQLLLPRTLFFWIQAFRNPDGHSISTKRFVLRKKHTQFVTPRTMLTLKSIRDELLHMRKFPQTPFSILANTQDPVASFRWTNKFFDRITVPSLTHRLIQFQAKRHGLLVPRVHETVKNHLIEAINHHQKLTEMEHKIISTRKLYEKKSFSI